MTLTEFLLARIAEDEAGARKIAETVDRPGYSASIVADYYDFAVGDCPSWVADYDPTRVLAECEARRGAIDAAWSGHVQIEGEWGSGQSREAMSAKDDNPGVVEWIALPYADHPDYQQEWKP